MIHGFRGAAFGCMVLTACNGGGSGTGGSFGDSVPVETSTSETGDGSTGMTVPTTGEGTTTTTATTTSAASTGASSSSGGGGCVEDIDCEGHPDGPLCVDGRCTVTCMPADTKPCYTGPLDKVDVGACLRGTSTCDANGLGWGACEGEVLPLPSELCGNLKDDDCNGDVDEDVDADGDGWGVCSGDCCDIDGDACFAPAQVNPGAFEYVGNDVDDDCDGEMDELAEACDAGLASGSGEPLNYARAIDLCTITEESPDDPKDRTWGVISAKFSLADGKGAPAAVSRSIRTGFGAAIKPQKHNSLIVLSSGHAADATDKSPAYAPFESGQDLKTTSPPPMDWLAANDGKIPNPPGCPAPLVPAANDAVMLTLRIRVPTNASSFSARMYFMSAEYPEYVCSKYNDFFVALVDSKAVGNPADKNVAVYDDGKTQWPIGVNIVKVADGLFSQCEGGPVGCAGVDGVYNGCKGTAELVGTGFDAFDNFACNAQQKLAGGGSGWLTLRGNVDPGEVMEIRLAVWDTGGHLYDSLVLLDAWEWSLDPAEPGVTPG